MENKKSSLLRGIAAGVVAGTLSAIKLPELGTGIGKAIEGGGDDIDNDGRSDQEKDEALRANREAANSTLESSKAVVAAIDSSASKIVDKLSDLEKKLSITNSSDENQLKDSGITDVDFVERIEPKQTIIDSPTTKALPGVMPKLLAGPSSSLLSIAAPKQSSSDIIDVIEVLLDKSEESRVEQAEVQKDNFEKTSEQQERNIDAFAVYAKKTEEQLKELIDAVRSLEMGGGGGPDIDLPGGKGGAGGKGKGKGKKSRKLKGKAGFLIGGLAAGAAAAGLSGAFDDEEESDTESDTDLTPKEQDTAATLEKLETASNVAAGTAVGAAVATPVATKVAAKAAEKGAFGVAKGALKAAKFIPGVGLVAGGISAGIDGVSGYNDAENILDIKGREATTTEKLGAGAASVASGLTFGLVDSKTIAGKASSIGSSISNFFSSPSAAASTPEISGVKTAVPTAMRQTETVAKAAQEKMETEKTASAVAAGNAASMPAIINNTSSTPIPSGGGGSAASIFIRNPEVTYERLNMSNGFPRLS